MGFSDSKPSSKPWKVSVCAKAEGFMTAELQVASPGRLEKKGFLGFLARIKRRSRMEQHNEGAVCDASLRVRARLFFFKARVAAGRLCELHVQTQQCNLIRYKSSARTPRPAPSLLNCFKGSSRSPSLQKTPSFLSTFLRSKGPRKGSFLVCGAGAGAFVFFLLHHASSWAVHFPTFALNAGFKLIDLFAKLIRRKCNAVGFKGAACFWQVVRSASSLFRMIMSLVSPMTLGNQFVKTAFLTLLIGVLLTGRANKLQELLGSSTTQRKFRGLKARILTKLLLTMQLIKRIWAHIGIKQACFFLLLLAFLTHAASGIEELG